MPGPRYRADIDALRALAVFAVLLNHFHPSLLPHGYLGVDVFFVISGFVVTGSLLTHEGEPWGEFLREFYARRIRRLGPGLMVLVLTVGAMAALLFPTRQAWLGTAVAALFGVSNLYLMVEQADYFALEPAKNFFAHTWSLGVEEQFYLVFPVLLRLAGKRAAIVISVLSTASLAGSIWVGSRGFYTMPTRFWELGAGALVYLGVQNRGKGGAALKWMFWALAAALSGVLAGPGTVGLAVAIAAALVWICSMAPENSVFSPGWAVWLGQLSYSIYLWHWPILYVLSVTLQPGPGALAVATGVCILVSAAQYYALERPLRTSEWGGSRRTIIAGLVSAMVAAATLFGAVRFHQKRIEASGLNFGRQEFTEVGGIGMSTRFRNGTVDFTSFDMSPRPGHGTLWVLGDSTGESLRELFYSVARERGYGVRMMTARCMPLSGYVRWPNNVNQQKCFSYSQALMAGLEERLSSADLVFIAQNDHFRTDLPATTFGPAGGAPVDADTAFADVVRRTADFARASPARVIVFLPTPSQMRRAEECYPQQLLGLSRLRGCTETMERHKRIHSRTRAAMGQLAETGSVSILDVTDVLCAGGECPLYGPDGVNLYRDNYHLTNRAADLITPLLLRVIDSPGQ